MDFISTSERIQYELLHCATQTSRSMQKSINMEGISRTCHALATEIYEKTYCPSVYTRFAVTDPKIREIYAPSFRDRLVQSWLVLHLNPAVERVLIDDTFANRIGKGALASVWRVQRFMRQPGHSHYLQLDIQSFFNSITLSRLMQFCEVILERYFATHPLKECLHNVLEKSILHPVAANTFTLSGDRQLLHSIPSHKTLQGARAGCGLPLGSTASQMFANLYLSPLDHFIKHNLRVKGYARYMDDLLLLGSSSQQLSQWRNAIRDFVQHELELTLHPNKQTIQACRQGADYLGYKVYPHHLHLRKRNISKLLSWLRFFNDGLTGVATRPAMHIICKPEWKERLPITGKPVMPDYPLLQQIQSVINSYFGMMKHAQHYRLRKTIYHQHFGALKSYLLPSDQQYSSIRIKKGCLLDWIAQQS